jgi:hypothetical protein
MKRNNELKKELVEIIQTWNAIENRQEDLSDLGNNIGMVVGKYFKKKKWGFQKDSFLHGINHGLSLMLEIKYKDEDIRKILDHCSEKNKKSKTDRWNAF